MIPQIHNKKDKTTQQFSGDLNNLKETGFIYANGDATNIPINGYAFYVTTIALNDYYVHQEAKKVIDASSYFETYERECYGGTWTEWKKDNIETIENKNGTAIKYPNGDMICRHTMDLGDINYNKQYGFSYIEKYYIWNFPAQFINDNIQILTQTDLSGGVGGSTTLANYTNKTGTRAYPYSVTQGTLTTKIYWSAIGKWK